MKDQELSNAMISKSHVSKPIAIYSNQKSSNILLSSIDEDETQKRITQQSAPLLADIFPVNSLATYLLGSEYSQS